MMTLPCDRLSGTPEALTSMTSLGLEDSLAAKIDAGDLCTADYLSTWQGAGEDDNLSPLSEAPTDLQTVSVVSNLVGTPKSIGVSRTMALHVHFSGGMRSTPLKCNPTSLFLNVTVEELEDPKMYVFLQMEASPPIVEQISGYIVIHSNANIPVCRKFDLQCEVGYNHLCTFTLYNWSLDIATVGNASLRSPLPSDTSDILTDAANSMSNFSTPRVQSAGSKEDGESGCSQQHAPTSWDATTTFNHLMTSVLDSERHAEVTREKLELFKDKETIDTVTVEDLVALCTMTRGEIAAKAGITLSTFRRLIGNLGFRCWPSRKYRKMQKRLTAMTKRYHRNIDKRGSRKGADFSYAERYHDHLQQVRRELQSFIVDATKD